MIVKYASATPNNEPTHVSVCPRQAFITDFSPVFQSLTSSSSPINPYPAQYAMLAPHKRRSNRRPIPVEKGPSNEQFRLGQESIPHEQ